MPDSAQPSLIHARGLTKRFGEFTAVDAIDFDVATGESFGFLGPNGAGKTSTMRMIGCVSPVSDGTLTVLGEDPNTAGPRIRAKIGVVPQQDYDYLYSAGVKGVYGPGTPIPASAKDVLEQIRKALAAK